ncbi:hypothetical protein DFI02_1366 [Rhizobium sp. PP-F2F-G20b]|nr:hypothetical protein DFI02_1366 [Rhizobium sp. PP-F2F-G20b]
MKQKSRNFVSTEWYPYRPNIAVFRYQLNMLPIGVVRIEENMTNCLRTLFDQVISE